jgi:hypothetical protein
MPFEAMRSYALTQEEENVDADEMPPPDDYVEPVEATIYPADPCYCVTVFYDPEVIQDDAAFNELHARMERAHGGREIYMRKFDRVSLEYERLSQFPEREARFLRRGYVDDVEGRIFDQGGVTRSRYVTRNIAAFSVNAMLMAVFLHKQPLVGVNRLLTGEARWRSVWKAMAPVMGKETVHDDERDERLMAHMEARPGGPFDAEGKTYALVEYQGLLLGCTDFRTARSIHWAYEMTPLSAWFAGDRDGECGALFGVNAKEVRKQIRFEANNIRFLFRPESIGADAAQTDVTPAMIATWYSQN